MANVITLLFVDLAAMLDQAAVATQAAQLKWDEYAKPGTKPQLRWDNGSIRVGIVFLAKGLKHKKKEYWLEENRKIAQRQAAAVGALAAKKAKDANQNAESIGQTYLQAALDEIFPPNGRPEEPCPF